MAVAHALYNVTRRAEQLQQEHLLRLPREALYAAKEDSAPCSPRSASKRRRKPYLEARGIVLQYWPDGGMAGPSWPHRTDAGGVILSPRFRLDGLTRRRVPTCATPRWRTFEGGLQKLGAPTPDVEILSDILGAPAQRLKLPSSPVDTSEDSILLLWCCYFRVHGSSSGYTFEGSDESTIITFTYFKHYACR